MTRNVFVVLTVLAVSMAAAQVWEPGPPRAVDYLGESGGALLGGVLVGAGATVVLTFVGAIVMPAEIDGDPPPIGAFLGALAGAMLGYPAGCGLGATLAGERLHVDGNTGAAYGGAFLGMGVGALGFFIPDRPGYGLLAMAALAPAGAAIGYSVGATREAESPIFGARLFPPAVTLRQSEDSPWESHRALRRDSPRFAHTIVDCRLVTMRF